MHVGIFKFAGILHKSALSIISSLYVILITNNDKSHLLQAIFLLDDIPLSIKKFDLSDVASFGTEEFLFKIKTESGTELLLKAESISSMQEWVQVTEHFIYNTEQMIKHF